MTSMKSELPVTDDQGHLLGMITLKGILNVPEDQRENLKVGNIIIPKEHLAVMQPDNEVEKTLHKWFKNA